ncbi:hypothetical protein [Salsipaludibacter albus]|uniref:hypothetical protein n=1 Tax=Salsipaludibacter albus TaxID=2849650 RepID=UPI001EE3AAD2|nr:hypothetical protein [Salsipaludibacter albus]MBY5163620.1 hypothetical protein [Salsipaludibacter albus]
MTSIATRILATSPVSTGQRPSRITVALALAPSLAYLVAHATAGATVAMVAASVAAAAAILVGRRNGRRLGVLVPAQLVYLALRTLLGVVTGSDLLYFGSGLALSALVALVVGATAFTPVPAAVHLIPLVTPYRHLGPTHHRYRRVAAHVTAAWATAELATIVLEAHHLLRVGGAGFVQGRMTVAQPAMFVFVGLLISYVRARLDHVESHLAQRHQAG